MNSERRKQLAKYRGDSDCINDLLTEIEALEKQLADIKGACIDLLDTAKYDERDTQAVVLAVYILRSFENEN